MIYWELFLSFLQIGAFSFGGGYGALPLIKDQVVNIHQWMSAAEFMDLVTISQMTPGPIAINAATFVGTQIAGVGGAVVATLGCVLPSCFIVLGLTYVYYKYKELTLMQGVLNFLRPAVVAMIASAGLSIIVESFWKGKGFTTDLSVLNLPAVFIFIAAMVLLRKFKLNPIVVMLISGGLGLGISLILKIA